MQKHYLAQHSQRSAGNFLHKLRHFPISGLQSCDQNQASKSALQGYRLERLSCKFIHPMCPVKAGFHYSKC
jgi:hypothetical protein